MKLYIILTRRESLSSLCAVVLVSANITTTTLGPVVLWWVLAIAGGLDCVEDLLELLTGQTHHAVLQSCVATGQRVLWPHLSTGSCPTVLRLSRFPIGSQRANNSAVFVSV